MVTVGNGEGHGREVVERREAERGGREESVGETEEGEFKKGRRSGVRCGCSCGYDSHRSMGDGRRAERRKKEAKGIRPRYFSWPH